MSFIFNEIASRLKTLMDLLQIESIRNFEHMFLFQWRVCILWISDCLVKKELNNQSESSDL